MCLMSLFFSLFCLYHYYFSVTFLQSPSLFMVSHSLFNICSLQYFLAAYVECGGYHEKPSCKGTDTPAQSNYNLCWAFELQAQLIIFCPHHYQGLISVYTIR